MRSFYARFTKGTPFSYLLLFAIPISVPLTRLSLKFLIFFLVFELILSGLRKVKVSLKEEDRIAVLLPSYQLLSSLINGELLNFLRSPHGLTPSLSYFIRISGVEVMRALKFFLAGALLLASGVILQSLLSVSDFRQAFSGNLHPHLSAIRPQHTFVGHPLTAGAVVSTAFFLSILFFLRERRTFYAFAAVLSLSAVVLLFDRTYWVAVFLIFLLISLLILRNWRFFLIFTLGLALSISAVPQLKGRFLSIFDLNNGSNRYRIAMWKGALDFYAQAPLKEKLIGVGREGYRKKVRPFVERAQKEYSLPPHLFSHLHSNFLTVLIWYGLIGLALFLTFFLYFAWANFRRFTETGDFAYLFFFSFYLLILLGGIFEYNFEDEVVKYMVYTFTGLNAKALSSRTLQGES